MKRKVGHFESAMMKGSSCKVLYFVFRFSLTFNLVIKASFLGGRELERNGVRIKPFISNAGKPQHLNRFPLFLSEKVHCSVSPRFNDGPVLNGSWFFKLCIKSVHASSLAFSTVSFAQFIQIDYEDFASSVVSQQNDNTRKHRIFLNYSQKKYIKIPLIL